MPLERAELLIAIGIILLGLSFVSLLAAYADQRRPLVAAFVFAVAAVFAGFGLYAHPSGVPLSDVPHLYLRVIGSFIH